MRPRGLDIHSIDGRNVYPTQYYRGDQKSSSSQGQLVVAVKVKERDSYVTNYGHYDYVTEFSDKKPPAAVGQNFSYRVSRSQNLS